MNLQILCFAYAQFGQNASNLAVPFFISNLLAWFQNPDETLGQGVLNIALLTLFSFAGSGIFFSWNVMVSFRTGMDIRSVCNSQIYRKAMRLSTKARSKMTQGAIMTLMSTDAEKLPLTMITIHNTWASPLIIFFGLYFLYTKIQNAAFVALAILLGAIPLQMVSSERRKSRERHHNTLLTPSSSSPPPPPPSCHRNSEY